MTDEKLKRLRELADAATPGPWTPGRKGSVVAQPDPPNGMWVTVCEGATGTPDGDFILAARTALPALLDEVERLRSKGPLFIAAGADLPEGTAALLQPGQIVYMHNLHSEDVVAARKAERERCAAFLRKSAGDGDSVMSDTWAAAVAAEMAALPDE